VEQGVERKEQCCCNDASYRLGVRRKIQHCTCCDAKKKYCRAADHDLHRREPYLAQQACNDHDHEDEYCRKH
jgi:hypothetical protein